MSSKFLAAIPVLGLGSASVFAGYRTYRLAWPLKWFEPKLAWGPKLTFSQHQKKMKEFEGKFSSERYEKTLTLREIPMPGNSMIWAHQEDSDFWKQRSEALKKVKQTSEYSHIPHEVNKLKTWCSLYLNTRVHVSKGDGSPLKFRISKDDHVYVTSLAQVNGLSDIKNNCARVVTNEEYYGEEGLDKSNGNWNDSECAKLAKNSYSGSVSTFRKCLKAHVATQITK